MLALKLRDTGRTKTATVTRLVPAADGFGGQEQSAETEVAVLTDMAVEDTNMRAIGDSVLRGRAGEAVAYALQAFTNDVSVDIRPGDRVAFDYLGQAVALEVFSVDRYRSTQQLLLVARMDSARGGRG